MGLETEQRPHDINDSGLLLNFERKTSQWKLQTVPADYAK